MLTYFSLEIISYLELVIKDVKIDISTPSPITIQCEICGVSKVIELIFRKTDNKEMIRKPGAI